MCNIICVHISVHISLCAGFLLQYWWWLCCQSVRFLNLGDAAASLFRVPKGKNIYIYIEVHICTCYMYMIMHINVYMYIYTYMRINMYWRLLRGSKDIFRLNCSHRRGGDFERVYPLIRHSADRLVGIESELSINLWLIIKDNQQLLKLKHCQLLVVGKNGCQRYWLWLVNSGSYPLVNQRD